MVTNHNQALYTVYSNTLLSCCIIIASLYHCLGVLLECGQPSTPAAGWCFTNNITYFCIARTVSLPWSMQHSYRNKGLSLSSHQNHKASKKQEPQSGPVVKPTEKHKNTTRASSTSIHLCPAQCTLAVPTNVSLTNLLIDGQPGVERVQTRHATQCMHHLLPPCSSLHIAV